MKNFLIKYKQIIVFSLIFVAIFALHFVYIECFYDDIYFANIKLSSLGEILKLRYETWSSRIFIEAVLVILLKMPSFIFYLLNTFVIFLAIFSISYIFTTNGLREKLIVTILVLLISWSSMREAGWYATLLNYLWPASIGLFALTPLKKYARGEMLTWKDWYKMPAYVLSLIFACNQEQMCALVFAFYLIFVIYLSVKDKKPYKFLIFQTLFALFSLIFILTCKGNSVRNAKETLTWFPEFQNLGFIQKFVLGVNSTISIFLVWGNWPLLIFILLIPVLLWKSKFWIKVLSFVPAVLKVYCTVGKWLSSRINLFKKLPFLNMVISNMSQQPELPKTAYLLFVLYIMLVALIAFLLFEIGKNDEERGREIKFLLPLIFLAGFASRVIMGFSPNLYVSGFRTYLFFTFAVIALISLSLKYIDARLLKIQNQQKTKEEVDLEKLE